MVVTTRRENGHKFMSNLPSEYDGPESNQIARQSDEKFCHACSKVLHHSAATCPSCGAAQRPPDSQPPASPQAGTIAQAAYCHGCGGMVHVSAETCPKCGARQHNSGKVVKSRVLAGILALFLGGLGIHKFYCGRPGLGILYLLFCWTFIPGIIAFFEALIYFFTKSDEEFTTRYCS